MEEKLQETLDGYCIAARQLGKTTVADSFDNDLSEDMQSALVRMAAAIALDERLEKCEAFLSEESSKEVNDSFFNAQEEITRVLEDAFLKVEKLISMEPELEKRVEQLSVSTKSEGLADDLLKLYKCEGIIRMAYRSAQKIPVYGIPANMMQQYGNFEAGAITDQERYIMDKMGVDICALMEARTKLVADIQNAMGNA